MAGKAKASLRLLTVAALMWANSTEAIAAFLPIHPGRYVRWGVACVDATPADTINYAGRGSGFGFGERNTCRVTSVAHTHLYSVHQSCETGPELAILNVINPSTFAVIQIQRGSQLLEIRAIYRPCQAQDVPPGDPNAPITALPVRFTPVDAGALKPGVSCAWQLPSTEHHRRGGDVVAATDMETIAVGINGVQTALPYRPGAWVADFSLQVRGLNVRFKSLGQTRSQDEVASYNYVIEISDSAGHKQQVRATADCGA